VVIAYKEETSTGLEKLLGEARIDHGFYFGCSLVHSVLSVGFCWVKKENID